MAIGSCDECNAIHQELRDVVELSRQTKPGPDATPEQLAAWFDERDEDDAYRMRVRTALSTLRRRMTEHQQLTGHNITRPFPSGPLSNWN